MMETLLVSAMAAATAAGGGQVDSVQLIEITAVSRSDTAAARRDDGSARCSERRSGRAGREMLVIRDAETGEIIMRLDPDDHREGMGRVLERVLDDASTS